VCSSDLCHPARSREPGADRESDDLQTEQAQPAPYTGHEVIRGEIQDRSDQTAESAPYSGQVVKRGIVRSANHS
jgi:hypothetical protein